MLNEKNKLVKVNLLEHSTGRNAPIDMLHKNECF